MEQGRNLRGTEYIGKQHQWKKMEFTLVKTNERYDGGGGGRGGIFF
jgi:hypothetical protein